MNRRDTIIIAVLLNTLVLAILFMMAVNSEGDQVVESSDFGQQLVQEVPSDQINHLEHSVITLGDEMEEDIDPMLNEFTALSELPFQEETERLLPYEPSTENLVEITVKKGDVLDRIARANGTTVEAIKKVNHLKTDRLTIGQILRIPVKKVSAASAVVSNQSLAPSTTKNPVYYTLKSGDSPWKIAKQFNVDMNDLLRINDLDEEKARNLKVGDKIRIP